MEITIFIDILHYNVKFFVQVILGTAILALTALIGRACIVDPG
ncbi:cytochrome B6 [Leptotrichia shahii]|nr:cytochrome B6 [Leptotrichia shahii]